MEITHVPDATVVVNQSRRLNRGNLFPVRSQKLSLAGKREGSCIKSCIHLNGPRTAIVER